MWKRLRFLSFFKRIQKSRELPVFLVFVFLSFCFWFLNALRHDYSTDIKIPVAYTHWPVDVMTPHGTPEHVLLKVRSDGFTLLNYLFVQKFDSVLIRIDQLPHYRRAGENGVYFVPRHFDRLFNGQLQGKVEKFEIQADTLFIPFQAKRSRKIAVRPKLNITLEKQYMVSGPVKIFPDSVKVSGDRTRVDTMRWISAVVTEEGSIKDTLVKMVNLQTVSGMVYSVNQVRVSVPVESFTEKSVNVNILARNIPDNSQFKSFPSSVKVSFLVGLSMFEQVQASDFLATVDCADIHGASTERLKVKIEKSPSGISNLNYSPIFVDYLIEKNRY